MAHPSRYLQEYLQSDGYPIIKIPKRIKEILSEIVPVPDAPEKPVEPKKPVLTVLPQPTPPKKTTLSWLGLDAEYTALMRVYKRDLEEYPKFNKQFKEHYNYKLQIHERDLELYKNEILADYERELGYYHRIRNLCQSNMDDIDSRIELLYLYLWENATEASPYSANDSYAKGMAELYFKNFLLDNYKDELILTSSTITSEGHERLYAPDFILQIDNVLKIDIEIDEPYVASSNKPTHFLEDLNERKRDRSRNFVPQDLQHVDSKRDNFFLANNWVVVRFTERQVIESPEACIHLLNELINYLWMQTKYQSSSPYDKVKQESKWTKYAATHLAEKQYRQSYLPTKLAQAVTDARNIYLKKNPTYYDDDNDLPF